MKSFSYETPNRISLLAQVNFDCAWQNSGETSSRSIRCIDLLSLQTLALGRILLELHLTKVARMRFTSNCSKANPLYM